MKALLLLLSFLSISNASALEVLGVVGSVVPAKPYYENLLSKQSIEISVDLNERNSVRAKRWAGDYSYDSGLTAGSFTPFTLTQKLTNTITKPLCLIANDQRSRDWLAKSGAVLAEIKAVCYLVKFGTEQDLNSLREVLNGVQIYALDPSFIADRFSVPFYPALISKQGVEQ